jgi:hypothetical protein
MGRSNKRTLKCKRKPRSNGGGKSKKPYSVKPSSVKHSSVKHSSVKHSSVKPFRLPKKIYLTDNMFKKKVNELLSESNEPDRNKKIIDALEYFFGTDEVPIDAVPGLLSDDHDSILKFVEIEGKLSFVGILNKMPERTPPNVIYAQFITVATAKYQNGSPTSPIVDDDYNIVYDAYIVNPKKGGQ